MAKYKVAPGQCILLDVKQTISNEVRKQDINRLMAGEMIPDGLLTPREIKNKLADGCIVAVGGEAVEQGPLGGTVPGEVDMSEKETPVVVDDSQPTKVATLKKPQPEVKQDATPWTLDPSTLEGKDLDELLVMIAERDEDFEVEAIESVSEAIEFLSQDFETDED